MTHVTRREFLSAALLAPAAFAFQSGARLIGAVALGNPGGVAVPPFGRLLGSGLDARLFTDLSLLSGAAGNPQSEPLVSPNDRFFVRTAVPSALPRTPWTIRVGGLVHAPVELDLRTLEPLAG